MTTAAGKPKVFVCMPSGGEMVAMGAARSFFCCYSEEMEIGVRYCGGGSASNQNFNAFLALALDERDRGNATHFAMIHSDVSTSDLGWIDTLYREMAARRGHFISAIVPIKDSVPHDDIRTSTAIRGTAARHELWQPRRYLMCRDRPLRVPGDLSLSVTRFRDQMPEAGRGLVAVGGHKGAFAELHIRVFDAAGRVAAEARSSEELARARGFGDLCDRLAGLPEPIETDGEVRAAIVRDAAALADYRPRWTLGPEDICEPDEVLLLNIGLCLLDLSAPGIDDYAFTCFNMIGRSPETGDRVAYFRSEDWEFSHHLQRRGARVLATWAVPVRHHGERTWANYG